MYVTSYSDIFRKKINLQSFKNKHYRYLKHKLINSRIKIKKCFISVGIIIIIINNNSCIGITIILHITTIDKIPIEIHKLKCYIVSKGQVTCQIE